MDQHSPTKGQYSSKPGPHNLKPGQHSPPTHQPQTLAHEPRPTNLLGGRPLRPCPGAWSTLRAPLAQSTPGHPPGCLWPPTAPFPWLRHEQRSSTPLGNALVAAGRPFGDSTTSIPVDMVPSHVAGNVPRADGRPVCNMPHRTRRSLYTGRCPL